VILLSLTRKIGIVSEDKARRILLGPMPTFTPHDGCNQENLHAFPTEADDCSTANNVRQ
jgi:hypothetical protein